MNEREQARAGRFWLIVHEPGLVPVRKGPWAATGFRAIMREFIAANPTAYLTVLTVDDDGTPDVQHGPEALQMADGRSMSIGRKHNERTFAAHKTTMYKSVQHFDSEVLTLAAKFGPVLHNAFPKEHTITRGQVAEELAALAFVSSPRPTEADMAAFGASDAACHLYPGKDQQAERAAFCEGAAHSVARPTAAEQEEGVPVLWVSPGQLAKLADPEDNDVAGDYLPARKTTGGNFTMPLFATQPNKAEAGEALREALRMMVYETTSLSPMEPNGDHWCRITAATLAAARAALSSSEGRA